LPDITVTATSDDGGFPTWEQFSEAYTGGLWSAVAEGLKNNGSAVKAVTSMAKSLLWDRLTQHLKDHGHTILVKGIKAYRTFSDYWEKVEIGEELSHMAAAAGWVLEGIQPIFITQTQADMLMHGHAGPPGT
jgi:hypothetical protein